MKSIAKLASNPTMQGGYNIERFIDKSGFVNEFICSICSNILRDPLVTPCEHIFCSQCIKTWPAKSHKFSTCPIDRKQLEASQLIKPTRTFFSFYNNLELQCKNNFAGCEEIFFMADIASHEKTCVYSPVNCRHEGCDVSDYGDRISTHESTCVHRLQKCEQCRSTLKHRDMDTHRDILCPETQIVCDCGETRPRYLFQNHCDNECANTIIRCPAIDCTENIRRGDIITHILEQKHLMFVSNLMENVGSYMHTFMGEFKESLGQMKSDANKRESKAVVSLNRRKSMKTKSCIYLDDIIELNIPNTTRWRLRDVSSLLTPAEHARSITTTNMYNFPSGVCFKLHIYFFGKHPHSQDQMGIFFQLQAGLYDDKITWPFNKKVTITLVSQRECKKDVVHKSFTIDPVKQKKTRQHYQEIGRPTQGCICTSSGWGKPDFIPQTVLRTADNTYVRNDQLYIDIRID